MRYLNTEDVFSDLSEKLTSKTGVLNLDDIIILIPKKEEQTNGIRGILKNKLKTSAIASVRRERAKWK